MLKLSERLEAVANEIRSVTHVDVGSDHGLLLVSLLQSGRIQRGIAIENKRQPFENSVAALRGLNAEVRMGDGLEKLKSSEADSLTICGMGGKSIVRILSAFPEHIPPCVVLQPNRHPDVVREWALNSGFRISSERVLWHRWKYTTICFQKNQNAFDPAYDGLDREAAILLGPLFIKTLSPHLIDKLRIESKHLQNHAHRCDANDRRIAAIDSALVWHENHRSHFMAS